MEIGIHGHTAPFLLRRPKPAARTLGESFEESPLVSFGVN